MGIKDNVISLFCGACDVYEMEQRVDERGVTGEMAVLKHSDIKCRLVFGGTSNYAALKNASGQEHKNDYVLNVRVFIAPDIYIKPGSLMVVRQNDALYRLKSTAESCIYRYHQEIMAIPYSSEV